MYVEIDLAEGELALREPTDTKRFKAVVLAARRDDAALSDALGDAGWVDASGDLFIVADVVRSLAGELAADATWQEGFRAMVAVAEKHGWLSDDGRAIRAHCELAPTTPN